MTFAEALDECVALAKSGGGGAVLTPNVDHVCLAETNEALVQAYADAALSLADGMPLVWLSRAMGQPLPEKISGSDLVGPLVARAAREGLSVFLLGAKDGVGLRAADALKARHPELKIAGVLAPPLGFERDPAENASVLAAVTAAKPAFVLVALGAPKQELWIHAHHHALAPAVLLGIGATLDFIAGDAKRAPQLISRVGMEWLWRLAQEPRRLAHRYLVRDRAFAGIALRALRRRPGPP